MILPVGCGGECDTHVIHVLKRTDGRHECTPWEQVAVQGMRWVSNAILAQPTSRAQSMVTEEVISAPPE